MWNSISLVQDLNSSCRVHLLYSYIHIHNTNICRNIVNNNDDFNERTNTLLYKNIALTLYSRKGEIYCVWEVSWIRGQTATYSPQVLLTIEALLLHSGWAAQPWVTEGPKPYVCCWLSIRHLVSNCNSNIPKSSVAPGYIIVWHPPASAYLHRCISWLTARSRVNMLHIFYDDNYHTTDTSSSITVHIFTCNNANECRWYLTYVNAYANKRSAYICICVCVQVYLYDHI